MTHVEQPLYRAHVVDHRLLRRNNPTGAEGIAEQPNFARVDQPAGLTIAQNAGGLLKGCDFWGHGS